MPVQVAARSKAQVFGRSPAETVGSNTTEGMDVCLLWVLCVVRYRSLRRTDHSSRGVLPTVVRRCVWSRNLEHEEAKARYRAVEILLYPGWSRVQRIMDVIPRGTELELQLRRGVGQALYTCNNIHIKCTGVYWAQAEKYCYKWTVWSSVLWDLGSLHKQ